MQVIRLLHMSDAFFKKASEDVEDIDVLELAVLRNIAIKCADIIAFYQKQLSNILQIVDSILAALFSSGEQYIKKANELKNFVEENVSEKISYLIRCFIEYFNRLKKWFNNDLNDYVEMAFYNEEDIDNIIDNIMQLLDNLSFELSRIKNMENEKMILEKQMNDIDWRPMEVVPEDYYAL